MRGIKLSVENEIKQKLVTLEQMGIKDNDFKVELVKLLVLVDILEKISKKYKGLAPLNEELQYISIEYPPHEYHIPLVGKVNFFGLIYGEISYHKRINYPVFHVILVKTYRSLNGRATHETKKFVDELKMRIYTSWRIIDEKYFREVMMSGILEAINGLQDTLSKLVYDELPFPLNFEDMSIIESQIEKAMPFADTILKYYEITLETLRKIKEKIDVKIPTEQDSVALARYPATDFEDRYAKLIPIIIKKLKGELTLNLNKLWKLLQKLPNPNILSIFSNKLLNSKLKEKATSLLQEYSKVFLDFSDKVFLLKERIKS